MIVGTAAVAGSGVVFVARAAISRIVGIERRIVVADGFVVAVIEGVLITAVYGVVIPAIEGLAVATIGVVVISAAEGVEFIVSSTRCHHILAVELTRPGRGRNRGPSMIG